jgi:hypothetical protein
MPSDRRQLNVRLDPQTSDIWDQLLPRVQEAVGVELSQPQVIALAIRALAEKYPAAEQPAPPPAKNRRTAGGRSQS